MENNKKPSIQHRKINSTFIKVIGLKFSIPSIRIILSKNVDTCLPVFYITNNKFFQNFPIIFFTLLNLKDEHVTAHI